jgi:hypothetical protein
MKKIYYIIIVLFVSAGSLILNGCKKDDTTAPVVTLNGNADMSVALNSTFTDPGATANDDNDGNLTATASGTVDMDTKGDYTLTYSATDAAGNTGTASRTVHVVNSAESWAGTYAVRDSVLNDQTYTYSQVITTDAHVNNRIHFSKFADYQNNSNIYAAISGNTIDLPSQTATSIGTLSENHTFQGNGTKSGNNFVLTYTDQNTSVSGNPTANGIATYTKQ